MAGINSAALSVGNHRLYLRTFNAAGRWGGTAIQEFVVDEDPVYPALPAAPGNIVLAEYFFDSDPGFGNGTPVALTPGINIADLVFSANIAALPDGNHTLFLRSKDDWSITAIASFLKGNTLPLHLLSFTGRRTNNGVDLKWVTDNEVNTAHFDIEKSADGVRFAKIAQVEARNLAGRNEYAFTDGQPLNRMAYYRLKQVDLDGRFTLSPIISIRNNVGELVFSLSPNPAGGFINIVYPGKKNR
ncbi:hypothetical protein [Paraflavitalea speifideaquila]|uniref:hypothetical protein n=1 Tax=Paraflavitalea speifideaquila TaxID=3076558 RepID=UPI0028E7B87B|nr:hypothetical protein [Paraflavitalea speifideiaquila]